MVFNSFHFAYFFLILFPLYWALPHRPQNLLLLLASYYFYACWDCKIHLLGVSVPAVTLLILSTAMDYWCGLAVDRIEEPRRRKLFVALSMTLNLGMLAYFKYSNFFAENVQASLARMGVGVPLQHLEVVLPIGISFYTFQSMSYVIDVYRRDIKPTRNFVQFAAFVSFFPHLVAGPIMRPTTLLPQIEKPRRFDLQQFYQGSYLIFWGLAKKIVVADNLSKHIVDPLFNQWQTIDGGLALLAIYAFAFQIYCDFSGYTDAARGIAKCLGIELALNFNLPYFATSPQDFWNRWHISLSTWLRDYLYIPLGGSRGPRWMLYRNLMLTMIIGGLWHGAAWTFVLWGTYQGLLLVGHRLLRPWLDRIRPTDPIDRACWKAVRIVATFHMVCLGWLIFRAEDGRAALRDARGDRPPAGDPGVVVPAAGRRDGPAAAGLPGGAVRLEGPRRDRQDALVRAERLLHRVLLRDRARGRVRRRPVHLLPVLKGAGHGRTGIPRTPGRPALGLIGMLGLMLAVEWSVARHKLDLVGSELWEWSRSGRAAYRDGPANEVLCFGSSISCFGLQPPLIQEHVGKRTFNFAVCAGPPPASYFLLRRALASGARPAAVLVDFHPNALDTDQWHTIRFWPELLSARECLELSWSARDAAFFAEGLLAAHLPSVQGRFALRDGVAASLRGQPSSKRQSLLGFRRNKQVNRGALLASQDYPYHGEVRDDFRKALLPDSWAPRPVGVEYARKFVELAASRGIPVFWVIPPFSPALQQQREAKGLDASYRRFARAMLDAYPNLVVLNASRSGYAVPAFCDAGHLNRRGAVAFTTEVAAVLRDRLDGRGGPRWVDLPPYRERPTAVPMEDIDQSVAAVQASIARR